MDNQSNLPAINKLLARLQSLSAAAHFFLSEQNRGQEWQGWKFETTQAYLQEVVFSLRLAAEESAEFDFRKFLDLLDQFLASSSEDLIESTVPTQVLENLTESLDEASLQNEELVKKIQDQNEARLAYLKRQLKYREEFNKLLQTPPLSEEEIQAVIPQIIEKLQPEMALLKEEAKRAETNEALRPELREKGQAAFEKAVQQTENLSPAAKNYLLSRKLSAETVAQIAVSTETNQAEILVKNAVSPLTETERKFFQENIIPALAANAAFLRAETTPAETEELTALIVGQKIAELVQEGVPQDKILNCLLDLSEKTQKLVVENPKIALEPTVIPPVVYYKDKIFVPLTSPAIPGNPEGKVFRLSDQKGNPAQDLLRELKIRKIVGLAEDLQRRDSRLTIFKLAISGISPEELEKAALWEKRTGSAEGWQRAKQLQNLAAQLRQFRQENFSRSSLPEQWIANRTKAISGLGKIIKPGLETIGFRLSQKNLQTLFGRLSGQFSPPQKSLLALSSQQGLSLLKTIGREIPLARISGSSLRVFERMIIAPGFSRFSNATQGFLFSLTAPASSPRGPKHLFKILGGVLALILVIILGIGNAFLGEGKGGFAGPGGQTIEGIPPECTPSRHLSEEVICQLTQGNPPCDQEKVNLTTWAEVNKCFIKISLSNGQEEIVRQAFYNSVSNYLSLQCVGFVAGIQAALNQPLNKLLVHNSACDYLSSPPPQNYRLLRKDEPVEAGDLAVWNGSACGSNNGFTYGHIAIVIAKGNNVRITIAEAIGDDKGVRGDLLIREVANDGAPGSPGGFLRYSP